MARKKNAKPGFPCRHFSLANKQGPAQSDLPKLLRRLARQVEKAGIEHEVRDVIVRSELEDDREVWIATVYFGD